ncbi:extracellular catalytic domain type 1 short-chain-length polyhydroxyalkanoate depolymerase [Roseitranquillus sediminis]|uniref:extracellular catalytic domain type 1 short-chain-length polyhydroxyalkanoate depolymerase n=1 Tax=Roseitranquillus sediminis TaxID=2809051 RepID=UPI001D0C96FE|nr:PHB depolymerase family esterase [Roseitranquillus sediminis]
MGRALDRVRASEPQEATRLIQAALAADRMGSGEDAPIATSNRARPGTELIDPEAEDAVIVNARDEDDGVTNAEVGRVPQGVRSGRSRRSLRDVIDGLSRGRPQGIASQLSGGMPFPDRSSAAPTVPEGALYEWRSHAGACGSRDYRLYVPASLPDGAQGLIVMLHGCTQNPDDFASGTSMNGLAEQHGLIIAYPTQTRAHNAQGCWNWFRAGDQRRGVGEPAIIAGLARKLISEFDIDSSRVFVAGLSAGGAMAAILGEAYPDLFVGIGVHSGLPAGCASDVVSAFAAMRGEAERASRAVGGAADSVRTIVFHGAADATVHPSNGNSIITRARRGAAKTQQARGTSRGGRKYATTVTHGPAGVPATEHWLIEGAGHAWSGGSAAGSYTDPAGPDASAEMVRFFLAEPEAR